MRAPALVEFEYVLRRDRELPPEDQTVFTLRPLSLVEKEQAEQGKKKRYSLDGEYVELPWEQLAESRRILDRGLSAWRNMKDANGAEIQFAIDVKNNRRSLPDAIFNCLDEGAAIELANAIVAGSAVTKEAAKNS